MISSSIEIDKVVYDSYDSFGFLFVGADKRTAPDEKEDAVTSYAGESGEHRDGRTCYAPFDYKVEFLVEAKSQKLDNVNTKIREFNRAIREKTSDNAVMKRREITFYNQYDRVKITGIPQLISEPTELYHSRKLGEIEYAKVELIIRVTDPRKCDFCLEPESEVKRGVIIGLSTDGTDINVSLSRPLDNGEALLLIRRGRAHSSIQGSTPRRYKSRYTWHINAYSSTSALQNILGNGKIKADVLEKCKFFSAKSGTAIRCRKASGHIYICNNKAVAGFTKQFSFACAVYRENTRGERRYLPKRISNVAYFHSNLAVDGVGENGKKEFRTWFST